MILLLESRDEQTNMQYYFFRLHIALLESYHLDRHLPNINTSSDDYCSIIFLIYTYLTLLKDGKWKIENYKSICSFWFSPIHCMDGCGKASQFSILVQAHYINYLGLQKDCVCISLPCNGGFRAVIRRDTIWTEFFLTDRNVGHSKYIFNLNRKLFFLRFFFKI